MNAIKTVFLLTLMTVILVIAGGYIRGINGAIVAFFFAAVLNFASYFFSDKIALASYNAQPVSREQLPRIYAVVERLVAKANLPMPRIYVIPTQSPNAFATGRNPQHAAVAVTEGILQLLNDEELEGVLAHELGHVRNRDILTSSIAATLAGAITILARMAFFFGGDRRDSREGGSGAGGLIMLIVGPIAATLIQLWVSRTREYEADASGAHLTGNPYALASALEKIDAWSKRLPMEASPASAHLFIAQPFLGEGLGQSMGNLFSTHPPMQKRIERLIGRPSTHGDIH